MDTFTVIPDDLLDPTSPWCNVICHECNHQSFSSNYNLETREYARQRAYRAYRDEERHPEFTNCPSASHHAPMPEYAPGATAKAAWAGARAGAATELERIKAESYAAGQAESADTVAGLRRRLAQLGSRGGRASGGSAPRRATATELAEAAMRASGV